MWSNLSLMSKQLTLVQRLEGLVLLALALGAYRVFGGSWLTFILLLLVFDVSMLGYLKNPRIGAVIYNLGHTLVFPGLLIIMAWANGWRGLFLFALIWIAHIGMDRLLGFGLKYPDSFAHTHLSGNDLK